MEKSLRHTAAARLLALGIVKQYITARKRKYYQRLLLLKKNMTFRQRMFVRLLWQKLGLLVTETFIVALAMLTILTDIAVRHGALLMWYIGDTVAVGYFGVKKNLYLKTIRN